MAKTTQMAETIQIDPAAIVHREGLLWHWRGPELPWGDIGEAPRVSELVLEEDGRPLGPAHTLQPDIVALGGGRYAHWGRDLFFSSSDGSPPDHNGRRYTVRLVQPVSESLHQRLMVVGRRLGRGWAVPDDELSSLLTLRDPDQRAWVFEQLGLALLSYGRNREGGEQLRRAWVLGRAPALSPCVAALLERGAFHEIWPLITRAVLVAEARGDVDLAVESLVRLHEAMYAAYAAGQRIPGYQDPVVSPAARRMLAPYRRSLPARRQPGPLRVGYLLAGEAGDTYSSLPDIAIQIACGHDPSKVTPILLSFIPQELLAASPFHAERQARLEAAGIPLHFIDIGQGPAWLDRLLAGAAQVEALDLDALIPLALTRWGALLAMLRPARAVLGIGLGDPHLYASPDLDLCVHFATKPAMDAFCPSATAPAFMPGNRFGSPSGHLTRPGLGFPTDVPILFASGRPLKFRSQRLWEIVAASLARLPDLRFAACGLDQAGLDDLPQDWLPSALRPRVHALGWRNDILDIYPLVDIVIDTVPYGGGYSLAEPMSLGIPVIGFRDNPLEGFREHTWLPTVEMLGLHEEAFDMEDTAGAVSRIHWLTVDVEHRRQAGEAARASSRRWADSTAFVRAMEEAIETALSGPAGSP